MVNPHTTVPLSLRDHEIRLVTLKQSDESEPIKCSLEAHVLDENCPEYVALSYTWGSKERHADILLNGVMVPVGRSLWSFLQEMRAQHQYIDFWIDAICIDQLNVLEQNHQVQMMRQIYSKAQSVWIWLGEADTVTNSDLAMQFFKISKHTGNPKPDLCKLWTPLIARAVWALCLRDYWSRIWIVQEVLLAKQALVLCGKEQVHWTDLQHFVIELQHSIDQERPNNILGAPNILATPAAILVKAKLTRSETCQPLAKLVELYQYQLSTNISDKVYALHGLAGDSTYLQIDYSMNPRILLVEMIWYIHSPDSLYNEPRASKVAAEYFAWKMNEVLGANLTEEELKEHVSAAYTFQNGILEGLNSMLDYDGWLAAHRRKGLFSCSFEGCGMTYQSPLGRTQHERESHGPRAQNIHMEEDISVGDGSSARI